MGITVTFVAILELVREGLIDIVQAEPFAPLHVRSATPGRMLRVVSDQSAPANEAELATEAQVFGQSVASGEAAAAGPPDPSAPPSAEDTQ